MIEVADSLNHRTPDPVVVARAEELYGNLPSICVPVQQQRNGFDCGVHAIANAVEWVAGGDPSLVNYDLDRMREHLNDCFAREAMDIFPATYRQ